MWNLPLRDRSSYRCLLSSATKVRWFDHVEGAQELRRRRIVSLEPLDTWLVWSHGWSCPRDRSFQCRSYDATISAELKWDDEILEILNIPRHSSVQTWNLWQDSSFILRWGADCRDGGDRLLFGQLAFEPAWSKILMELDLFIIMNTGEEMKLSENNLLTTIVGWWRTKTNQDSPA